MGARHGQYVPALQDVLAHPLGAAGVAGAGIEDGFHQRELGRAVGQAGSRHHVADHEHVGVQGHLVGAEAFDQINAECAELVAHGRVNTRIAAGDLVTSFAGQGGHAPHERAANAKNVNVHGQDYRRRGPGFAPGGTIAGMDTEKQEIAATAAALVVDEGLDYGSAKRRALKALGLPARTPLPDKYEVEAAVREHIAIFHADTQPGELRVLRELALEWMERLAEFQPLVGGAVWHGTATRMSDIQLQLFSDDPKAVEIWLINQGVDYEARSTSGLHGHEVPVLSTRSRSQALQEWVGVHLLIHETRDQRGALLPDELGRKPRGDAQALRNLLVAAESDPS